MHRIVAWFSHTTRTYVLGLVVILSTISAQAQGEFVPNVSAAIATENYGRAKELVDSALQVNPNDVNALMMKGNVLLNYGLSKITPIYPITLADENPMTTELAGLAHPPQVVPAGLAHQVDAIWQRCLQLDASRTDIRSGLCTLYGMAVWRDSLMSLLPAVINASRPRGDSFAYVLETYGQLLEERGDTMGARGVYRQLEAYYPSYFHRQANACSDTAWKAAKAAFVKEGNISNQLRYAWQLFCCNKMKEAERQWKLLQARQPSSASAYFLARCNEKKGLVSEALQMYQRIAAQFEDKFGFLASLRAKK
ncbi:MAG: hypothetical protein U0T84_07095 [Chitinophagales bacterium]